MFVVLHLIPRPILGPGPEGIVMSQLHGECGLGRTAIDCDIIYSSFVVWSQIGVLGGVVLGR